MPLITAVSFEEDSVRVVTGRRGANGFTPDQLQTFTHEAFEAFLPMLPGHELLVAVNSADVFYETITIPPVDDKLTLTLASTEMARLHPELSPFSCSAQVIGDLPMEGRTVRKIACCLMQHGTITPLLESFIRHNKTVRYLTTAPIALVPLAKGQETQQADALLCAYDMGTRKTLFLLENGAVTFARSLASNAYGWDTIDRQNISMTMDYCFQTLRVRPSKVLVLSPDYYEDETAPFPHLEPITQPNNIAVSAEVFRDYLTPLLLAASPLPASCNLLPQVYRNECNRQRVLKAACITTSSACILMAALVALRFFAITALQTDIDGLKKEEIGLQELHRSYQHAIRLRDSNQALVSAMNSISTAPDIPTLLSTLNDLRSSGTELQSLTLKREKDNISFHMAGSLQASSFAANQQQFESFTALLQKHPGISLNAHQQDPQTHSFTLDGSYKP